jgi:hypothetical protein
VTNAGQMVFAGTPCYELKVITQSGLEQSHYYNVSNYFLVSMLSRVTSEAGQDRLLR